MQLIKSKIYFVPFRMFLFSLKFFLNRSLCKRTVKVFDGYSYFYNSITTLSSLLETGVRGKNLRLLLEPNRFTIAMRELKGVLPIKIIIQLGFLIV